MPACTFRYDVMNADTIMNVELMATAVDNGATIGFRRCQRPERSSKSPNLVAPSYLFCTIAFLFLVAQQPVTAFTAPRTTIGLGLYRHRINNHTTDGILLGATTPDKNGTDESDEHEGRVTPSHGASQSLSTTEASGNVRSWNDRVRTAYRKRINADPSFFGKSITEVTVAAGTQLMAEWNRRGASRMVSDLDFVVPAVLTAVFGKYYSMWRTAKTLDDDDDDDDFVAVVDKKTPPSTERNQDASRGDPLLFGMPVPTNAFQPRMADGRTTPTTKQRLGSFLAPIPALFRAGTIASGVGYGIMGLLITLRTWLIPSYRTGTIPVNVLYASVYTGCFMAVVSNVRYQILQGLVEPILIDRWIFSSLKKNNLQQGTTTTTTTTESEKNAPRRLMVVSRSLLIFIVRWLNGLLGSVLAITGMRVFGLQRLKS